MKRLEVSTRSRSDMVDITREAAQAVAESGIRTGVVHLFVPHTTAGISINENADPDVQRDVMKALERAVPNTGFAHFEGNSDAHAKAQMTGFSVTVIVEDGRMCLGTWQGIYLCEFDGPRQRRVFVQTISETPGR